jgi:beta-galactosidase
LEYRMMLTFDYGIVRNPEIFQQNRLPAHSDHLYYENPEASPGDPMEDRVSLNGKWKFSYAEDYREAATGFEQPGYDVSDWDEIPVPRPHPA